MGYSTQRRSKKLDREDLIGRFIHYLCLYTPTAVIGVSLVIMSTDPYGYIRIGGRGIIHAISALSLSTAFLFIYLRLQYLYPLVRAIITGCFTILSIHLYDFTWSLGKYLRLGYDFRIIPLIAVAVLAGLLVWLDLKHRYLNSGKEQIIRTLLYIVLFGLSFIFLMSGGFYEAMELYDNGLGPDPNVGCIIWAIGKITVFWVLIPLIQKFSHKAPLRLDPRVLIW